MTTVNAIVKNILWNKYNCKALALIQNKKPIHNIFSYLYDQHGNIDQKYYHEDMYNLVKVFNNKLPDSIYEWLCFTVLKYKKSDKMTYKMITIKKRVITKLNSFVKKEQKEYQKWTSFTRNQFMDIRYLINKQRGFSKKELLLLQNIKRKKNTLTEWKKFDKIRRQVDADWRGRMSTTSIIDYLESEQTCEFYDLVVFLNNNYTDIKDRHNLYYVSSLIYRDTGWKDYYWNYSKNGMADDLIRIITAEQEIEQCRKTIERSQATIDRQSVFVKKLTKSIENYDDIVLNNTKIHQNLENIISNENKLIKAETKAKKKQLKKLKKRN